MDELPKNFPEYAIMYRSLTKKIKELELGLKSADCEQTKKIKKDIRIYETEANKIKEKFPENFFEDIVD